MDKHFKKHFSIEGHLHPTIIRSVINDKRYAVCGGTWIEIPEDMTFQDVQDGWIKPKSKSESIPMISQKVESSKGKKSYTVSHNNGHWSCTCSGYGFRKKCSHIDKLKSEYESI
jgi:hypothetical protein